jgi:anti-sigma regulatory factor (Ser/Thr protein kinase)
MTVYSQSLPGVPGAARAAREFTAAILAADCPARDDALLCVSEMVTNAVQHSKSAGPAGLIRLRVEAEPGERVQIAVQDDGPAPAAEAAPDGEHGRGLLLVGAVADSYGNDGQGLHWCRLAWDPQKEREPQMNGNQGAATALSIPETGSVYGPQLPTLDDLADATLRSAAVLADPQAAWADRQQVLEAEEAAFLAYEATYPQLDDPDVNQMVTGLLEAEAELEAGI